MKYCQSHGSSLGFVLFDLMLQVPPAELEALLLTHPAILDAAVIP